MLGITNILNITNDGVYLLNNLKQRKKTMSINIWYNAKKNEYNVYYDGKRYTRKSYVAIKEVIDDLASQMTLTELYAA